MNGEWLEGQQNITKRIMNFFSNIYTPDTQSNLDECILVVPNFVTNDMNAALLALISATEVKNAAFSLGAQKAPGLNGFNGIYSKRIGKQLRMTSLR